MRDAMCEFFVRCGGADGRGADGEGGRRGRYGVLLLGLRQDGGAGCTGTHWGGGDHRYRWWGLLKHKLDVSRAWQKGRGDGAAHG